MTLSFSEPSDASGVRLNPDKILNHLLIVWPIQYIEHSPTRFTKPGDMADAVIVDVVDLDQVDPDSNQPGILARKTWWRQARLIQSLRPSIEAGDPSPKLIKIMRDIAGMGQTAPYQPVSMLSDPTSVARAQAWAERNPGFTPSAKRTPGEMALGLKDEPQPSEPVRALTPQEQSILERMARAAGTSFGTTSSGPNQGDIPF